MATGAGPGAAGPLEVRRRRLLFFSAWVPVRAELTGTQLRLTAAEGGALQQTLEVAGCGLTDIADPPGFLLVTASGQRLRARCRDEDDKVAWLTPLYEAKLTRGAASGASPACAIQ